MTPTATKARPNVLAQLAEYDDRLTKAEAEATRVAREHHARVLRYRDLQDERRRLIYRDPSLVDHQSVPVGPRNPVGKLDTEIAKLGDLEDLGRLAEHNRKLAEQARQSREDFVGAHFAELVDAKRPEAEAVAASANKAARAFVAELQRYVAFHGEIVSFTIPRRDIDGRSVPGLNEAADLLRRAESVDLQPPILEPREDD
jgi:hypothetical protein